MATKRLKCIAVYSGKQVWPMGLLFIKTSPLKQCSYQNDLSGVFDALHQRFLVCTLTGTGVGSTVTLFISGLLCDYGFDNGWGSVFYLTGMFMFSEPNILFNK